MQTFVKENIYKLFSEAEYLFESKAINDICFWYYNDKRYLLRLVELINDIKDNPVHGGLGKTETLSKIHGRASKRIVKKDRIVYTFTRERIVINQCRGTIKITEIYQ